MTTNIADLFDATARRLGPHAAIAVPIGSTYKTHTFAELLTECDRLAHGLSKLGIGKRTRVLLMTPPGFEFVALTFALFKIGATPVLIDPGMGKQNLLDCVSQSKPEAMIAIPKAHLARLIYGRYFRTVKTFVTVGRRYLWGGTTLNQLRAEPAQPYPSAIASPDDLAAILFTTGSTGPPKGVLYPHKVFAAQVEMIRNQYGITDNDVDLPVFPLFALFSVAMGMSVVIPDMDPTRPAEADPQKICDAINSMGVTFSFGSPALWRGVSSYCVEHNVTLPGLRRVLMAGAPVPRLIHEQLLGGVLADGASTHTPFGATESLPVCDITGATILATKDDTATATDGLGGVLVGKPLPGMRVEIIEINNGPIGEWNESLKLPPSTVGEIVVKGPVVTPGYFEMPERDLLAKIGDTKSGGIWHRMGDMGYIDSSGLVRFCGRMNHRVMTRQGTFFTIPCEGVFNKHSLVFRSALVGLGDAPDQEPVIIIELEPEATGCDRAELAAELFALAVADPKTISIKRIYFHQEFPTDIRHNAKIFREKLAVWASERIGESVTKS